MQYRPIIIAVCVLAAIVTAYLAYNVQQDVLKSFKLVDEGLHTSNTSLSEMNLSRFDSVYRLQQKDTALFNKVVAARNQCAAFNNYIDSIKKMVALKSGGEDPATGQLINANDVGVARAVFITGAEGEVLRKLRLGLCDSLIACATTQHMRSQISGQFKSYADKGGKNNWSATLFNGVPATAALTILSKFKNDCAIGEQLMLADVLDNLKSK